MAGMYDLIGDIHGHADELEQLLKLLGYQRQGDVFRHAERKVIFLGDFIDRGPRIKQVLDVVRPMVEQGHALAVMGNHELNALAFHTEDPERKGVYLRERSNKNFRQHMQTLRQLNDKELSSALDWFRTLPLWLDLDDGPRAVHACWDERLLEVLEQTLGRERKIGNDEQLRSICIVGEPLYAAAEFVLKGKEIELPEGVSFPDKDGHVRHHTRVRWFESAEGKTYREYALTDEIPCDDPLEPSIIASAVPYPFDAKPVFIGHYWLSAKRPEVLAPNVACLDYSVAKGGFLCAYRWQGEQMLSNDNFTWVES